MKLERTSTIQARVQIIEQSITQLQGTEWLIGKGLFLSQSSVSENNRPNHAHLPDNIFITLLSGTGIIGFMIAMLLIKKWGRILFVKSPEFFIITVAVITHSLFNNTFLQPFVFLMWLGGLFDAFSTQKSGSKRISI